MKVGMKLCEALGLASSRVMHLHIECHAPGDLATVRAVLEVHDGDKLVEVLREFELREKNDGHR